MPEYRRNKLDGGTFFFTVVTYHRKPTLPANGLTGAGAARSNWMRNNMSGW